MDQKKVDQFAERLRMELNAGMSCLNLYLGYRLDLYRAIVEAGAVTPAELAGKTGYAERYLREWLECMAVGGYLEYDTGTGRFALAPEHAVVLSDRDNSAYSIPSVCYIPSFASTLKPLMNAFRNGGGVPYEQYGSDLVEAISLGNRPLFLNNYVAKWIPAMPDIENRLHVGGHVLEVGCGAGWSSIVLARGFPEAKIDAIDGDSESIERARDNAREAGVAERIAFHLGPIEESSLGGPYDLVTTFECIHDLMYPVRALRRIRELVAPSGAVLVADEAVGDTLEENRNFLGHLNYNFSVLHCLPQAMVSPDSAATGTVLSPSKLRTYATDAGFSRVDILPVQNAVWRLYRLTP